MAPNRNSDLFALGAIGPIGKPGPVGPAGATGPTGPNGNDNIRPIMLLHQQQQLRKLEKAASKSYGIG